MIYTEWLVKQIEKRHAEGTQPVDFAIKTNGTWRLLADYVDEHEPVDEWD